MRLIKMLGLAAVAATAAMALFGTAAASAEFNTVLCASGKLKCENPVNGGGNVEIHLETLAGEPPVLSTSIGNVECETSLALITLLNELAVAPAKQEAHVLKLEFTGNCHLGGTACTVTVNGTGDGSGPGGLLLLKVGELRASATDMTLELKPSGQLMKTSATIKCGSLINCTYSAGAETLLEVTSDAQGHLLGVANGTPLSGSGFFCPKTGKWTAKYHAVDLKGGQVLNLFIES